jgi:hypothetical protein
MKASPAKAKLTASYDKFKEFEGRQYTGMKIGRGHKWKYDAGEWKEKKITPDKWDFTFSVTKRRAGHAPEGSGVPVGTEYHWFILAHQTARKINANDYTTSMSGTKFKIAHKRAGSEKWSAGEKAQRHRLIKLLQEMIDDLEKEDATPVLKEGTAVKELPKRTSSPPRGKKKTKALAVHS